MEPTRSEYPKDKCIHQLFEAQAKQSPEAIAVVCGDEQLSYEELDQRSNQLAHYLRTFAVSPETIVAICVERSIEMLVGLLGILKSGAGHVPLDATLPISRLNSMIEDSRARVVITQERLSIFFRRLPHPSFVWIAIGSRSRGKAYRNRSTTSDRRFCIRNLHIRFNRPARRVFRSNTVHC